MNADVISGDEYDERVAAHMAGRTDDELVAGRRQVADRMIEVLRRGWSRGGYARASDGLQVGVSDPEAVSFCLAGAWMRVEAELQAVQGVYDGIPTGSTWIVMFSYDLDRHATELEYGGVTDFNDVQNEVEPVIEFIEEVAR